MEVKLEDLVKSKSSYKHSKKSLGINGLGHTIEYAIGYIPLCKSKPVEV